MSTVHRIAPAPIQLLARLVAAAFLVVAFWLLIVAAWHLGAVAVVLLALALLVVALAPRPRVTARS